MISNTHTSLLLSVQCVIFTWISNGSSHGFLCRPFSTPINLSHGCLRPKKIVFLLVNNCYSFNTHNGWFHIRIPTSIGIFFVKSNLPFNTWVFLGPPCLFWVWFHTHLRVRKECSPYRVIHDTFFLDLNHSFLNKWFSNFLDFVNMDKFHNSKINIIPSNIHKLLFTMINE